ncbi:hypothetical protein SDC9_174244 [bioreactor metagenome]|uniref:Uncharacterized protein n=1 Tax=bioreactor metagenome TaxID=1076179 RepID=A0A645GLS7_9ZZZZ
MRWHGSGSPSSSWAMRWPSSAMAPNPSPSSWRSLPRPRPPCGGRSGAGPGPRISRLPPLLSPMSSRSPSRSPIGTWPPGSAGAEPGPLTRSPSWWMSPARAVCPTCRSAWRTRPALTSAFCERSPRPRTGPAPIASESPIPSVSRRRRRSRFWWVRSERCMPARSVSTCTTISEWRPPARSRLSGPVPAGLMSVCSGLVSEPGSRGWRRFVAG